jgi:hypothetical protein
MKKLILTFAIVLVAQLGMAQDAAFKADVKKVIQMTGASAQIDVAKKQIIAMIPADKQAAFMKEFDATLPAYFDAVEKTYMEEYTHDDVKQMIKFYETPVGKKMTSKAGTITEKTMQAAQQWSVALQAVMMKYMQ